MSRPTYRTIEDYPAYSIDSNGIVWRDTPDKLIRVPIEVRAMSVGNSTIDVAHVELSSEGAPSVWRPVLEILGKTHFNGKLVLPYDGNFARCGWEGLNGVFYIGGGRGTTISTKHLHQTLNGMSRAAVYLIWHRVARPASGCEHGLMAFNPTRFVSELGLPFTQSQVADAAVIMLTSAVKM